MALIRTLGTDEPTKEFPLEEHLIFTKGNIIIADIDPGKKHHTTPHHQTPLCLPSHDVSKHRQKAHE